MITMTDPKTTAAQWGDELAQIIARAVARATTKTLRKMDAEAIHYRETPISRRWRFADNSELHLQSDLDLDRFAPPGNPPGNPPRTSPDSSAVSQDR